MKTFTKSTILAFSALFLSMNMFANEFVMTSESYIDDIPFNTEIIAANAMHEQAMAQEFHLEDEAYIDDIPFNTDSLAKVILSNQAMSLLFEMEEENYIDDIPFNTSKIKLENAANVCYDLFGKK